MRDPRAEGCIGKAALGGSRGGTRCKVPPAPTEPDAEEIQHARTAFERHFGTFDSGDPNFSDNERIDADLAKEYGGNSERGE